MSRYAPRPAFDPAASYVSLRRLLLNGRQYEPGETIATDELHVRRVQALYDAKRIAMVRPATVVVAPAPAEPQEDADGSDQDRAPQEGQAETAGGETSPDAPPRGSEPSGGLTGETAPSEEPPASAPAPRVVKVGMGGWQVVNAEGAPVGPSHRTKKAAEAALAALQPGS